MKTNILNLKYYLLFCVVFIISFNYSYAQYPETLIRKGNSLYKKENFQEAEKNYRKAQQKDTTNIKSLFNMGDALYKQQQYSQAGNIFQHILNHDIDELTKAKIYHNLGNSQLSSAIIGDTLDYSAKQDLIKNSIDSYKKSLRLNPDDEDTRYNYVYANKLLKKIENQQNQQCNNDKNEDEKKEDKQDQQQNEQDKNDEQKDNQDSQKPEISKEDAERMLEAIKNREKETRENLDKKNQKPVNVQIENDW